MKKNIVIISVITLIIVFLITFSLSHTITELNGTAFENGNKYPVEIVIKNKKSDIILKRLSGNITINDGENDEKYDFTGKTIFHHPSGVNIVSIGGYIVKWESGNYIFGTMFFDDDMKNIIIRLEGKEVYSAEESFISKVKKIAR